MFAPLHRTATGNLHPGVSAHALTREEDGDGRPLTSGYGVSSQPSKVAFAYNSGGNLEGLFRVEVFQDGAMFPVPPPKIGAGWPPSTSYTYSDE